MTTKQFSLVLIALVIAVTCFARLEMWPVTQKPTLALAQAEAIGNKTIGEKHKGFFCIGARFAMLGATNQEWDLIYTSPKGERECVIIDGKGNAQLLDSPRDL